MFNLFKRRSRIKQPAIKAVNTVDVLVGLWENELDDSSGLHAIWGWSFRFEEDGTGMYHYWTESELTYQIPFSWTRHNQNTIMTKYRDDVNWSAIEYTLQIVDGPYDSKLLKLTDSNYIPNDLGNEGFWNCFGAIFKNVSNSGNNRT
jgi:hypothetical protein